MSENNNHPRLSPIYQVYSDLGYIDPNTVETEEDAENYYKKSVIWL